MDDCNFKIFNRISIVKVAIWFVFTFVCGVLTLFLLIQNTQKLNHLQHEKENPKLNILYNRGELVILYLFILLALTFIFHRQLK